MSSSEKSEFLSLPIPPSLVTLRVADGPLGSAPEVVEDPEDEPEDAEAVPKKLDIIDQRMVKGVKMSHTRDIRPPSLEY